MTATSSPRTWLAGLATLLSFACATAALAQVVVVPPTPQIGSSNPITAEPPVSRPHTTPCVVPLFNNLAFADFTLKTFSYAPPSACPGPWAKVVFTADFTVTAGRQFDRTAAFYLGHANIYYGTTAEPRKTLSPSWHVESDVTDLSAIFASPQTGEANIGNFVGVSGGVTYNGIIYANAALEFYPAGGGAGAPVTPDIVVPVNGGGGDAGTLNTTSDTISQTLNLPTNVERVYLDVIAQSQSNDEFWYFCVPNDQTSNLESCGNTAFRETEIWIDGQPAGVAPVYPWIYTGGIDPYLWEPIPGVQTLNFKPYRVDLTPFAGVLSDGGTHTVAVSVYNANSYFLATANLLAYLDHGIAKVSGGLLKNTLSMAPTPTVDEEISTGAGPTYTGTVTVGSKRNFEISGYINTSHGRVETTINQTVGFLSKQQFDVNANTDIQNAQQLTTVDSRTNVRGGINSGVVEQHFSYPLAINYSFLVNADGSFSQTTTSDQQDLIREVNNTGWGPASVRNLSNEVHATDTLKWDSSGSFLGPTGSKTTQTYRLQTSKGQCWDRTITAAAQVLTSVTDGPGCKH
ncbi:peptide-N4-asparagine amidase [Occallatibacter riparius]|uniref:Peptide-N(4)-(N-acetyl-beta-glucosaminyl)asparagine amidase n=1 Tax=Occallatibacter riparius TaxID=1002689 RepID=A0A9J7BRS4_9BACT|nr:peptide-N4-asparagine amidase [Occallatibacter riparius]UWZ85555.1 peptide-N(4)-(N-acetyl-beta-glucosaminyl)asparagine amidase [Occallatibacter riparius]